MSLHGKLKTTPLRKKEAEAARTDGLPEGSGQQEALKQLLEYQGAGKVQLTPAQIKVVDRIVASCAIPDDLEVNKCKYGALSGSSFEERVVSAYESGLLQAKKSSAGGVVSILDNDEETRDATQSLPRSRGATPRKARGVASGASSAAASTASASAAGALEVTPLRPAGSDATTAGAAVVEGRFALCYECGGEGHWRWECDERL